ncbi:MAG: hypothetical protein M3525_08880 [Acidobacteriota bacterium]|nr:hypothetical protein [Acidobacteriota bacterium]
MKTFFYLRSAAQSSNSFQQKQWYNYRLRIGNYTAVGVGTVAYNNQNQEKANRLRDDK